MKIDPTELYRNIEALERMNDEMGRVFDAAYREDEEYDTWRQRQDDEREEMLEAALNAALQAGVSQEHLKVLARECGAVRWALEKSLRS